MGQLAMRQEMEVTFAGDEEPTEYQFGDVVLAVVSEEPLSELRMTDVVKAVDLMERCSVMTRRYNGIWAYIYVRGRHVGYIWTQRYTLGVENATTDS